MNSNNYISKHKLFKGWYRYLNCNTHNCGSFYSITYKYQQIKERTPENHKAWCDDMQKLLALPHVMQAWTCGKTFFVEVYLKDNKEWLK